MNVWIKRDDKDGYDVVSAMVVFEVDNGKKYRILRKEDGKVKDWLDVEKDKVYMIADEDPDSENEKNRHVANELRDILCELKELKIKIMDDIVRELQRQKKSIFKNDES